MKISGFTFIRNGATLGYPFLPSIRSLLPLCDEVIVNVPRSTDDTLEQVRAIGDPKILILETEWDRVQRGSGLALSHHSNLALDQCTGDWCVYIQGDEVLHETSIPMMRAAMEQQLADCCVEGLLVNYHHFYGSFWTEVYSFGWYYREVPAIRSRAGIRSVGDAQSFRAADGCKLWVCNSGGEYFHYGYALKPDTDRRKLDNLASLYEGSEAVVKRNSERPTRYYDDDQKVRRFAGIHPAVMRDGIAAADWTYASRKPLLRFRREYFWEDIALLLQRCTGITLGVHKNFRMLT